MKRFTADTINDDELDRLYAERDRLRQRVQDWRVAAGAGMTVADRLRSQLDDVRRALVGAGLTPATDPDSDETLVELVRQGMRALDAHVAVLQSSTRQE